MERVQVKGMLVLCFAHQTIHAVGNGRCKPDVQIQAARPPLKASRRLVGPVFPDKDKLGTFIQHVFELLPGRPFHARLEVAMWPESNESNDKKKHDRKRQEKTRIYNDKTANLQRQDRVKK